MPEHPQDLRICAAKAFRESLDQLQSILADQTAESEFQQDASHSSTSEIDLTVLEEAAADIEQFLGEIQPLEDTLDEKS